MTEQIVDQTNDPGYATLSVLVERYPLIKEMAKTANIEEDEFSKLPKEAFAWPEERRYPIHTKAHAILSIGYHKVAASTPAAVSASLTKAAQIYDIETTVFAETPQVKQAAVEENWLLVEKKRFRVASADDVKVAEVVLLEKYAQLTVEDRAEAFHNLGVIARELDVKLAPSTYKLAGFTATSTRILKDWLDARKEAAVATPEVYKTYAKLAEAYTGVAPFMYDRASQVKLAGAIHELDQAANLVEHYGKTLPDPLQTVFNTEKISEDQMPIGTDFAVDKADLSAVPLTFWEDLLGPEITQEIAPDGVVNPEVLSQVIQTLPADIKAIAQKELSGYI